MQKKFDHTHSLSMSSSNSSSCRDHFFLVSFFLSPDFHELWCSVISVSFTEVKWQWASLVLGQAPFTVLLMSDDFAARAKPKTHFGLVTAYFLSIS